jgi:predicted ATPase/DNA-binding CsgD family transcriptional regulator
MSRGLPVELTSFVGRRKELAEGRRMLRSARLVTVAGPGGVGKTRLAGRLAHQVQRLFPDGVVWVGLATQQDPAALASEVATALEVETQGQPAQDALAAYLRSRELLLVLDNCEHLAEACAELVTGLVRDASRIRVLATSRRPLRVTGEHVMSVEPLAVPSAEEAESGAIRHVEAVALLADRARSVDRAFRVGPDNAEVVSRLVRRVDGIPLAIELAAARLRALSVNELVERLDDRFGVLTTGSRVAPPRHQTLRGLVDWSYSLCSPPEQQLWARMSVFDGGADLAAVVAVCGDLEVATYEILAGLVDSSVLSVAKVEGRDRYRMLETIREYGAERLAARGEADRVRARHFDHYLALARESRAAWFGPDQLDLVARTTTDLGNLRAAFDHALGQSGEHSAALHLASALVWYWLPAGAIDEGLRWFNQALAHERAASPALLRALADALQLCSELVDMEALARLGRRAVALPTPEPTPADRAARHYAQAVLAVTTDDYEGALAAYSRALAECQAAGDLRMQADILFDIAVFRQVQGRLSEAAAVLEEIIELCDAHGERFKRRFVLEFYGYLQAHPEGYQKALAALRAALTAWPVVQPLHVANTLYTISKTHASGGEDRPAAVLLGARVRIGHDFGLRQAPYEDEDFDEFGKRLTESLGETQFRTAYEQGYAMSAEEAVRFALGEEPVETAASSAHGDQPLSRRERQVAALLARGLSNKEIAEELVISPRTAEGHVAKVMDKLGVHSREDVAARIVASPIGQE